MAAPSTITITYVSTLPSTTSTVTLPITPGAGGGGEADSSQTMRNIARAGGFFFTDSTGLLTWIPYSQITKITAQ
jgi:hypothetical protein